MASPGFSCRASSSSTVMARTEAMSSSSGPSSRTTKPWAPTAARRGSSKASSVFEVQFAPWTTLQRAPNRSMFRCATEKFPGSGSTPRSCASGCRIARAVKAVPAFVSGSTILFRSPASSGGEMHAAVVAGDGVPQVRRSRTNEDAPALEFAHRHLDRLAGDHRPGVRAAASNRPARGKSATDPCRRVQDHA